MHLNYYYCLFLTSIVHLCCGHVSRVVSYLVAASLFAELQAKHRIDSWLGKVDLEEFSSSQLVILISSRVGSLCSIMVANILVRDLKVSTYLATSTYLPSCHNAGPSLVGAAY